MFLSDCNDSQSHDKRDPTLKSCLFPQDSPSNKLPPKTGFIQTNITCKQQTTEVILSVTGF